MPSDSSVPSAPRRTHRIDALLLLMAVIWGTNYSIVKSAFNEVDPQAFNAVRMTIASAVFLAIMAVSRAAGRATTDASIFRTPAPITARDWRGLAALGVVGHFVYQYLFIGGLARTSVANSSLILAGTPVIIALTSAVLGHERISRLHWFGAALSMAGIYLVVGRGATLDSGGFIGDVMTFGAVCCWAAYTIGAGQLMERHSPVAVTGLSMALGTLLYVPLALPRILAVEWDGLSAGTIGAVLYSALFALCVAYTIWYVAVRDIGSARTSVYSNIIPLVAMVTAVIFLGEPLTAPKLGGAALVLIGVGLTRVQRRNQTIHADA